jgi:1-deoxy-D-xylulose-5-phosphate synthase
MVIVVNDNARSYAPTIGGLAVHLAAMRATKGYEDLLAGVKQTLLATPVLGGPLYTVLHGLKKGISDIVLAHGMFEDLGLKYLGPFDGHDISAVEVGLRAAAGFGGPVIVHCITEKGRGYAPAEADELDRFHAVRVMDPLTGRPVSSSGQSWTSVFSDEMVRLGREWPDLVAVTAAMLEPTGLRSFQENFPDRVFDVGIAEQHAVASAAGLALGGLRPVVAVYATFLNRALDQVLMDVALHSCAVTFVLDRAGVTGDDGPSHNGMWDLSVLRVVPGLRICAPRDAATLRRGLREAVAESAAPTVLRFPKGDVGADIPAVAAIGSMDVLVREGRQDVLIIGVGPLAAVGAELSGLLVRAGHGVTVVDPRWILPVNSALVALAARHRLVVTIEDNERDGGVGCAVAQALRDGGVRTALQDFGLPHQFLEQGKRPAILDACGLTAKHIWPVIAEQLASLDAATDSGDRTTQIDVRMAAR